MSGAENSKPPLIELAKNDPEAFAHYAIQQIMAICGDGNLRDGSTCSAQLRSFLRLQPTGKLAEYVRQCLDQKFDKSGFVLQDVINEIGRRLGYNVTHGRYQGVANDIGFDGLWEAGGNKVVVEVKTTDAYRINLDTVNAYANKLAARDGDKASEHSLLIVVGRQDTGDLEAQVRGSRHAWSTRLISADALVKLMFINEEVDDATLVERIRRVLMPFEYTRVDNIVDLLFEAQQEIEQKVQSVAELVEEPEAEVRTQGRWQFTPRALLAAKRAEVVEAFFRSKSLKPTAKSQSQYSDADGKLAVTCSISKRYPNDSKPYWYALHPQWLEFMGAAKDGYFLLGCMDRTEAYALPVALLRKHLDDLNTTEKEDHRYWHIQFAFDDQGRLALNLTKVRKKLDLTPYAFEIAKKKS
jgi:hypothetical protein